MRLGCHSMGKNIHRLTASRILVVFSVCLFASSLMALQIRLNREKLEWVEYLNATGDSHYYGGTNTLGENDFFQANLRFRERPEGIFRRNHSGQSRKDQEMLALGKDFSGKFSVYTPADKQGDRRQPMEDDQMRFFLKKADDLYIEFGERKYWPEYKEDPGRE